MEKMVSINDLVERTKRTTLICIVLLGINILLLFHFLITTQPIDTYMAIVVTLLIGLATLGAFGVLKGKSILVYLYGVFSFVPVGFYLLLNPSPYRFIGGLNLAVLLIYQLFKENKDAH
jgi:hypothetical protein